ncbi:glycosyltransferase family 4 protein [Streptomyces sp. NPDC057743]|uniref:glycosyltransferase family 4 protein n=1 Tax=Streptomyces sp. NPDC057743 TaxID=3346236 RepID=UPI003686EF95
MIVHISDCFPPRTGGIESQVAALAAAQHCAGQDVHVVTATPAASGTGPDWPYPVHRVSARLPRQMPIHPRAGRELDRLLDRLDPPVVHVHVGAISPFAWAALGCARRKRIPTVVTVHSIWDAAVRAVYGALRRTGPAPVAPTTITAVSRPTAWRVRQALPRTSPLVIPNGIDVSWWRHQTPVAAEEDEVRVAAVGRLVPRKEPMELLAALRAAHARLARHDIRLRATFVGTGPSAQSMRSYILRHGMEPWVRLTGRMDSVGVRQLLAATDLFVNPSRREAFGIAALEARTCAVPVLARQDTGVADFVRHNREGALCRHSAFSLVDELVWLARTPGARHALAEHNRQTLPTQCTWPAVTEAFAYAYETTARTGSIG